VVAVVFSATPARATAPSRLRQDSYRWRNDDGSEESASWKQNVNTPHTGQVRAENVRVRVCIVNESGTLVEDSPSAAYRLEYAASGSGPWSAVDTGGGSGHFVMSSTTNYLNQAPTTDQLAQHSGEYEFAAGGRAVESPHNGASPNFSFRGDHYINMEYCFQARGTAPAGTYYFRAALPDAWPNEYRALAQLTLEAGTVPAITSALSVAAEAEVDFVYHIRATGSNPVTYDATSLPAWLSFDGGSTLAGAPPAVGTYTATIVAENGFGSDSETLTINVSAAAGVVVDDADANTTRIGVWTASGAPDGWAGGSLFGTQSPTLEDGYAVFRWTPELPSAGEYEVYARWTYHERRDETVPYRIAHDGGTDTVVVDQKDSLLVGKWNLLGTYAFTAGQIGHVEVSAENGQACADAVRFKHVTDPLDLDSDGLPDSWEITQFGAIDDPDAQPHKDPDGDRMSNIHEFRAGTVPTDEASVLVVEGIEIAGGTQPIIRWQSAVGKSYSVEKSTNLTVGDSWIPVGTGIQAATPQNVYTAAVMSAKSFYRVVLEP